MKCNIWKKFLWLLILLPSPVLILADIFPFEISLSNRRIRDIPEVEEIFRGIGSRIREARLARGLTQEKLAVELTNSLHELGLLKEGSRIFQKQISQWENEVCFPTAEKIPPLAEILGIDVYVLLTGKVQDEILQKVGGIAEDIGRRILITRLARGLTREKLAEELTNRLHELGLLEEGSRISSDQISRWENEVRFPTVEKIPPLAEILGIDSFQLVYGKYKESLPELENLGLRIKVARFARGLTEQTLADKTGVSRQTISYWENGITTPSDENLHKLARVLNLDIRLLTGSKD